MKTLCLYDDDDDKDSGGDVAAGVVLWYQWGDGLEYGRYGVSKVLDTAYRGFLGDLVPSWYLVKRRHRYTVSSLMDTAYWMSESFFFIFLRLSSRMRAF
ncbi:hypothetical protein Tco_0499518 [Tanacetum coccineum]